MATDCKTATALVCSRNGCALTTSVEIESPHMIDGAIVCDDCYEEWRRENESECPFCCEFYLDDELSDCFVFAGEDGKSLPPGLYRFLSCPRYRLPTPTTSHFNGYAVQHIGSLWPGSGVDIGAALTLYICKSCMGDNLGDGNA